MRFDHINKDIFADFYERYSIQEVAESFDIHAWDVNRLARKWNLARKNSRWRDLDLHFTDKQIEIINGSMLGDGCLNKISGNIGKSRRHPETSRFDETHGIAQSDWLKWKQEQLQPIPSFYRESEVVARKNLGNGIVVNDSTRTYISCNLRTIQHPIFAGLEYQWYKRDENGSYVYKTHGNRLRRTKIVPNNLILTPLALAVWYIDDGHNKQEKGGRIILCSLDFTKNEVEYLVGLVSQLGFKSLSINHMIKKHQDAGFCIVVLADSYLDFIDMVRAELKDAPECVQYKLDTSKTKLSWKKSPDYHPKSKFNDEIVKQIMIDAGNHMCQREIAKKYGIHYKYINSLLRGKRLYESEFAGSLHWSNTSGIDHCWYDKKRHKYTLQLKINGKYVGMGAYKDKETAKQVSNEISRMKKEDIIDPKEYRKIRLKYKKN